jgi:hypothetical protein
MSTRIVEGSMHRVVRSYAPEKRTHVLWETARLYDADEQRRQVVAASALRRCRRGRLVVKKHPCPVEGWDWEIVPAWALRRLANQIHSSAPGWSDPNELAEALGYRIEVMPGFTSVIGFAGTAGYAAAMYIPAEPERGNYLWQIAGCELMRARYAHTRADLEELVRLLIERAGLGTSHKAFANVESEAAQ